MVMMKGSTLFYYSAALIPAWESQRALAIIIILKISFLFSSSSSSFFDCRYISITPEYSATPISLSSLECVMEKEKAMMPLVMFYPWKGREFFLCAFVMLRAELETMDSKEAIFTGTHSSVLGRGHIHSALNDWFLSDVVFCATRKEAGLENYISWEDRKGPYCQWVN